MRRARTQLAEIASRARGAAVANRARMRIIAIFTLANALAACAVDPTGSSAEATSGKADGEEPTITFAADYTQTTSGTLLAGSPVTVHYDLARITDCRAQSNNSDVWGVTGYALFDDGTQAAFAVSNLVGGQAVPVDAELALPAAASSVQLWFVVTNEWGCIGYDSNYGANYTFSIDRHGLGATLAFGQDWSFTQSGPVHAGDRIVIHYAPQRLQQCQAEQNEVPAWGITAHWQVDGGDVHDVMAATPNGTFLAPADPIVTVPRGHDLALWFEATSIYGCHAWDSDYGANYHVTIE
jgi:hypothetical protein